MKSQKYLLLSERTLSHEYHQELVTTEELEALESAIKAIGSWADRVKRALYYGKMPPGPDADTAQNGPTKRFIGATRGTLHPTTREGKDALHAALGLVSESAELAESIFASLRTPKPEGGDHNGFGATFGNPTFDRINILEELGDLHWYEAVLYRTFVEDFEANWARNIAKLEKRFPDRFFSEKSAVERDLLAERTVLEQPTESLPNEEPPFRA